MGVIKTKAGGAEILIETVSLNNQSSFAGMSDTAINFNEVVPNFVENAFQNAKDIICRIAEDFSDVVKDKPFAPAETKIGFSMGLTTEGDLWLIKAADSMTLNVELVWKKDAQE